MNEEIVTLYEFYFQNPDNYKIKIKELIGHHCRFCVKDDNPVRKVKTF